MITDKPPAVRGVAAALATIGLAATIQLATAGSAAASVNDVITGRRRRRIRHRTTGRATGEPAQAATTS
jgi:hypothetical protein